jgi:hypothetical protein
LLAMTTSLPVARSRICAGLWSALPRGETAICLPSGLKTSARTSPIVFHARVSFPVAASHRRTVWSPPPVAICLPSGDHATLIVSPT